TVYIYFLLFFFFTSRRRHTSSKRDWSSDVCSSDLKSVSKISTRWIITKHVIKDVIFYALSSVHHINAKHYIVEKTLLYNVSIFIKMKDYEVGITAFVNKSYKEVSTIVKWVNDQFSFMADS